MANHRIIKLSYIDPYSNVNDNNINNFNLPNPSNKDMNKIHFYFFADSLLSAICIKVVNGKFEYAVSIENYPNMIQITLQNLPEAKCILLIPQKIGKNLKKWKKYSDKNFHETLEKIQTFCRQWSGSNQTLDDILNYRPNNILNIISDGEN